MQCNIGAKGKAVRLRFGIKALVAAAVLGGFILGGIMTSTYWWYLFGAITFSGAFTIFEARAGWCVVRAMGFKTPI